MRGPTSGGPPEDEARSEEEDPTGSAMRTATEPPEPDGTEEAEEHQGPLHFLRELPGLIIVALVLALVIKSFLIQAFFIPSESMVPTLKIGDRVLVNKLSYQLHDPRRGDIAVFEAPAAARTDDIKDLVKRIVGLPGETIEGKDGMVYIDGRPLSEPYLPEGTQSRTFPAEKVPPGAYFMLGDNRQYSKDSTFFGPIKRDDLIGRVFMRIWPPSHLGFL